MKIAVVTPYYKEEEPTLRACHDSVCCQTHPATHIMVADGHPQDWVGDSAAQHIVLPVSLRNYGDTPRAVASLFAMAQGFDGIAYLDADNWYQLNHVETIAQLRRETGAVICSTRRRMHRLDGSLLGDCMASDGEDFVDTNCLAVFKEAFHLLPQWALMPEWAHPIGDRMIWHILRQSGLKRAHQAAFTVCYRNAHRIHYEVLGEEPPEEAIPIDHLVLKAMDRWEQEGLPAFRRAFQIRRAI